VNIFEISKNRTKNEALLKKSEKNEKKSKKVEKRGQKVTGEQKNMLLLSWENAEKCRKNALKTPSFGNQKSLQKNRKNQGPKK